MDRGTWRATVHRVTKSDMAEASTHTCMHLENMNLMCCIRVDSLEKTLMEGLGAGGEGDDRG